MKFDLMTLSLSNYFILLQNQKASFNSTFLIFSFKTEFYHFFLKLHYSFQTSPTASPNSSATTGSSSSSGKKRSSAKCRITAPSPQLLALESFRISGHFGKQFRREIQLSFPTKVDHNSNLRFRRKETSARCRRCRFQRRRRR